VRLIGNKTKLLTGIEEFLVRRGVTGGRFLDVFAGTASVGRHFRSLGYRVSTNDLLMGSYVRQRAYITLDRRPAFRKVRDVQPVRRFLRSQACRRAQADMPETPRGGAGLWEVIAYLNEGRPVPGAKGAGLFSRHYSGGGSEGRLFFSEENGARIDAIHAQLVAWLRDDRLDEPSFYLLLTALLEAADRVANISGTYGAFLKQLQPSAQLPLRLRPPALDLRSPVGKAFREDANQLVRRLPTDVLYLDPPYNQRQYAKNYHVIEILAELHTIDDVAAYEAGIYGKTGLRAFEDRRSDYCRRQRSGGTTPCARAFADLVKHARAEHIVVSYSEEGILSRDEIGQALAEAAGQKHYDFETGHEEVSHKRFRSDRERNGRTYRVLKGRGRDEVSEWLFYVRKPSRRRARAHNTR
jgi:adenine-specific DNA-methyltransferase